MRLNEFADPNDYTPTATDAEDFLQQLLSIWPDRPADLLAPYVLGSRKLRPSKRMKRSDAQSIRSHVAGA